MILFCNDHRDRDLTGEGLVRIFTGWSDLYEARDEHDMHPLTILTRHAFEQFPYQESTFEEVSRSQALLVEGAREVACEVITEDSLNQMLGGPVGDVVGATFFLHVAALKNNGWFDPGFLDMPDLPKIYSLWPRATIEKRLRDLTLTVPQFQDDFHSVNTSPATQQRWAYDPLVAHPFIARAEGASLAPQPALILRTVTPGGLYYPV